MLTGRSADCYEWPEPTKSSLVRRWLSAYWKDHLGIIALFPLEPSISAARRIAATWVNDEFVRNSLQSSSLLTNAFLQVIDFKHLYTTGTDIANTEVRVTQFIY